MLGRVILTEKRELENERMQLITDVTSNKRKIKELEENLLQKLTTVQVCFSIYSYSSYNSVDTLPLNVGSIFSIFFFFSSFKGLANRRCGIDVSTK